MPHREDLLLCTLSLLVLCGSLGGCEAGKGSIHGQLGGHGNPGAMHLLQKGGRPKVSLDQVTINLMAVVDPADESTWQVVQSVQPNPDGSFDFASVPEGDYALKLDQPEFAGAALYIDSADFRLGAGQTVNVVLPITTRILLNFVGPNTHYFEASTGRIISVGPLGLMVVGSDSGTVDILRSDVLFNPSGFNYPMAAIAYLPSTDEVVVVMPNHIVRVALSILNTHDDDDSVVDFDDPAARASLGSAVRMRLIPSDRSLGILPGKTIVSADEGTLYVSTGDVNSGPMTAIIDASSLEVQRFIELVTGYHPEIDVLFTGLGSCAMINASQVRDIATVPCGDFVPVPGSSETWIVNGQENVDGQTIPFVKVVDEQGNVIADDRLRDFLGVSDDPVYGRAGFDETGDTFMIGPEAYRRRAGGGWEKISAQVPPGPGFSTRMSCANGTAVDPVNGYRVDYGCEGHDAGGDVPVTLFNMQQVSIPVAVKPGGQFVALDPSRGRAVFASRFSYTLVHYADANAVGRADLDRVDASPFIDWPICSDTQPCVGPNELCAAPSPTALSGSCIPSPRRPYTIYCGGMTDEPCDEGYDCVKEVSTNPFSLGWCERNVGCNDLAICGPICDGTHLCAAGTSCQAGRCVATVCQYDADCQAGEVCGMIPLLGRVCVVPGPLATGEVCRDAADCASGVCQASIRVNQTWPGEPGMLRYGDPFLYQCRLPCYRNADCPAGEECGQPNPMPPPGAWGDQESPSAPICYAADEAPCDGDCTDPDSFCMPEICGYYGESAFCTTDGDCMDFLSCIRGDPVNPDRMCLMTCADGADCAAGRGCSNAAGDGGACGWSFCLDGLGQDLCGPHQVCIGRDNAECVDHKACRPASGVNCDSSTCVKGLCAETPCSTNADCAPGENCVLAGIGEGGHCLPTNLDLFCDCGRSDGACIEDNGGTMHCVIEGSCANAPCDGTVAGCSEAFPYAPNGICECGACTWDATDCGGTVTPPCPTGYACWGTGGGGVGSVCVCNDGGPSNQCN